MGRREGEALAFGEPVSYAAVQGANALLSVAYTRDKLGRIAEKTETLGGVTTTYAYGYDLAGRLVEVRKDGVVQITWGYDPNGNRTHVNGAEIAHYDDQDRLLDYQGATYAYTANGELQTKTQGANVTQYDYDVLGNLRQVTLPNGTVIDYLTDGRNRRIGKKVNGTLVQGFLYQDQLKPVAELDGAGNVVSRFVYATRVNVPDTMVKGGVTYRIVTDHLGSPRLVVNAATGAVVQRMDYDAWGNVLLDDNPGLQPFGFAGGLYDRDTGLVRFGARDYNAKVGRWIARDPLGLVAGLNLYAYAMNDPVNSADPKGEFTLLALTAGVMLSVIVTNEVILPIVGILQRLNQLNRGANECSLVLGCISDQSAEDSACSIRSRPASQFIQRPVNEQQSEAPAFDLYYGVRFGVPYDADEETSFAPVVVIKPPPANRFPRVPSRAR